MHNFERTPHTPRLATTDSSLRESCGPASKIPGAGWLLVLCLALVAGCAQSDSTEYTEYVSEPAVSDEASTDGVRDSATPSADAESLAATETSAGAGQSDSSSETVERSPADTAGEDSELADSRPVARKAADAARETVVAKANDIELAGAFSSVPVEAETKAIRVPAPPLPAVAMSAPPAGENGADTTGRVLQTSASLPLANGGTVASDASPVPGTSDPTAPPEATGPREVKLLVKDRKFITEGPDGALRVSYDDFDLLKILNMEPVTSDAPELLPDWLRALDGKRVRVRGFMYPPFEETGLRGFVLARDNQICCFGRNPKVYDLVEVTMRKGVTANYIQNRPFDVVGIFRIEPDLLDDELFGLYKLEDAIVIDD